MLSQWAWGEVSFEGHSGVQSLTESLFFDINLMSIDLHAAVAAVTSFVLST